MALKLDDLDETTREYMLKEFETDVKEGSLYVSSRLSGRGRSDYFELLDSAIKMGSDKTLKFGLSNLGRMNSTIQRKQKNGSGLVTAAMPSNAPQTLAEGEFNRFYIRGLCRRAIEEKVAKVEFYRARPSAEPRRTSEALIGTKVDPEILLRHLRTSQGKEPRSGFPGPNSGLSVRLPR